MVIQTLDALAISPHPDDAEMCCGGTLAKLVSRGHRVGILDLTRGELASNGTPEERARESAEAAKVIGLAYRGNLDLPDGFIANTLSGDGPTQGPAGPVARLVGILRSLRPTILLAPPAAARHPDHVAAARLTERAVFFAGVKKYPAQSEAATFRPRRVISYMMRAGLSPDFVVDVSEVYETKRRAVSCYASQLARGVERVSTLANAPESHDALEARDRVFGGLIGVNYAEGFTLDGTLSIDNPVSHFATARPAVLFQDGKDRR